MSTSPKSTNAVCTPGHADGSAATEAHHGDVFTPTEVDCLVAFVGVMEWLPARIDAELQRETGLSTFEHQILSALAEAPERTLTMSELATAANGSPSRLSHAVRRLERPGWLSRAPDPEDARVNRASLTAQGAHKVTESSPTYVAVVRKLLFSSLDTGDVAALQRASEHIMARLIPNHRCVLPTQLTGDR